MISISIDGVNRDANVDYQTLIIQEKLYSHCNTASFEFYCNDDTIAPGNGEEIVITDDLIRIFAGRILIKEEHFLPPANYKYIIDCIDYHRDLDRKLVNEIYTDEWTGDIVRHIIATYCPGLTSVNVENGVLIDGMIVFEYIQPSECIKNLAELSQYNWYVDYEKDVHFFTQAIPNAPFKIDDDQEYYKDLTFTYDFSQLRNRVRVKGLGDVEVEKEDAVSIAAIAAIEGGDGIYDHIIVDETIKTDELAEAVADADLEQYKDIYIVGRFITNELNIKAGQLIEVDSVKRNLTQNFLIQEVSLEKITIGGDSVAGAEVPYKAAGAATVDYAPAVAAVVPYKGTVGPVEKKVYYVYHVTIASRLKDLTGLLLDMLHQEASILPTKDITPPAVPSGLTLYTGMGLTTQASLAWLKAEWNANTELDFSHYELRMKKGADSDFVFTSTKNITFMWYSLEPGETFDVYIRAVDLAGNASNWSSIKSKTTATDADVPAQLARPVGTPILAGIKVAWLHGTEDNISHYKVEREESNDNIIWGGWATIIEVEANMWLDLLLTYTKYYRYRVSTITQTGTSGAPSDPSIGVKPKQAGTGDIEALAITASQIAANSIYTNALQAGCIIASKINANAIESYHISANSVTASKISVTSLAAIEATLGTVHAGTIYGTRLRVGGGTNEDIYFEDSGVRMYDAGGRTINIYRSGYKYLQLALGSTSGVVSTNGKLQLAGVSSVEVWASSRTFRFYSGGSLQLPKLSSAPSAHSGDIATRTSKKGLRLYDGTYGWQHATFMSGGW